MMKKLRRCFIGNNGVVCSFAMSRINALCLVLTNWQAISKSEIDK